MFRWAALLLVFLLAAAPARAEDWPAKPVRIVVPFAPGSTPDMVARLLADRWQSAHSVPFVVDNKPGASGNAGTDAVAKASPDGATIGLSIGGPLAINTLLFSRLPYDPRTDIAPVAQLITQPSALVVHAGLGVSSVAELFARLSREPEALNYASVGHGSLSHLAMEAIAIQAGARPVHVPYPGSAQAVTALLRGDVQMGCLPAIAVTPHLQSGAIRILAVSTAQRSPYLPDVPTLKESGADVEADAWLGLIAPGGTPAEIVARISREVGAALQAPALRERLAIQLMQPVESSPAQFRALINAEIDRWRPVIESRNIRVN